MYFGTVDNYAKTETERKFISVVFLVPSNFHPNFLHVNLA